MLHSKQKVAWKGFSECDLSQIRPTKGTPQLCLGGCGFYGSHATEGLCSKCYKESTKKRNGGAPGDDATVVQLNTVKQIDIQNSPVPTDMPKLLPIVGKQAPTFDVKPSIMTPGSSSSRSSSRTISDSPSVSGLMVASCSESDIDPPDLGSPASVRDASLTAENANDAAGEPATMASSSFQVAVAGQQPSVPVKRNRCAECRKKVGLTGFECRCGGVYCGNHRYSDLHECSFDYKKLGEEEIRKANPIVKADKINKI